MLFQGLFRISFSQAFGQIPIFLLPLFNKYNIHENVTANIHECYGSLIYWFKRLLSHFLLELVYKIENE